MDISYSFEQWCLDNNRVDILNRWDYTLNEKDPSIVSHKSNKKYWFRCPCDMHESQAQDIQYLTSGRSRELYCNKCRSFAQHIINKYGELYLSQIWHESNTLDPWKISYKSSKKGIFICTENKEHIYEQSLGRRYDEAKCPYCLNQKINHDNSLGSEVKKVFNLWSKKNDKTPYDFSPKSGVIVWWICENNIHKDYQRSIASSSYADFKCPKCVREQQYKKRRIDITGQTFGELEALYVDEEFSKKKGKIYWTCKCSCEKLKNIEVSALLHKGVVTCGDKKRHRSGENNSNWKGGITPFILKERTSWQYVTWREQVYSKDWYTCQCCGKHKKINKNAHHIYNFSSYEDLRYSVANGITLCDQCHYTTIPGSFHNVYGTTNNTPEQLEEYINSKRKELGINIPFTIKNYLNGEILTPEIVSKGV